MSLRELWLNDGQSYQLALCRAIKKLNESIQSNKNKPNANSAAIQFYEEILELLKIASMHEDEIYSHRRSLEHYHLLVRVYNEELTNLRNELHKLQAAELVNLATFKAQRDRIIADKIKYL